MSYANARLNDNGHIIIHTHKGNFRLKRGEAMSLIADLADCLTGGHGQKGCETLRAIANGATSDPAGIAAATIDADADWTYDTDDDWWLK